MRQTLLRLYRQSRYARACLSAPRSMYKALARRWMSDEEWCCSMFRWAHGYDVDLGSPVTLNEKIQWLKLYNRVPEFTRWADKYEVRRLIAETVGPNYSVPLLASGFNPDEIGFEALPEPFIIKPNHTSGRTIIVRDKAAVEWRLVRRQCKGWLRTNLYREGREHQYKDIPPRILVEKLLQDASGAIPLDYKCHCIGGRVVAIQVDIDRETNHKRNFYTPEWVDLPFTWSVCAGDQPLWPKGRFIPAPAQLGEMLRLTELIARRFAYVRVDWYIVEDRLFFGEVTFHHGGGYERILPFDWDVKFGQMLTLPSPGVMNDKPYWPAQRAEAGG